MTTYDAQKLRKLKMKNRYGKKRVSIDMSFKKTMHQRARMKKYIPNELKQEKLENFSGKASQKSKDKEKHV